MDNIQLKYNLLDSTSKKEVRNFIDQLISKMRSGQKKQSSYKKNLLSVSTWSDTDVKVIEDSQAFNRFKTEEW
jgi:hypothetical protein